MTRKKTRKGSSTALLIASVFLFLLISSSSVGTVSCLPLKPRSTLIYTRPNGRTGDIAILPSGQLLFTNYPTKPGKIMTINLGIEKYYRNASTSTQDYYGVAVSPQGEVYFSVPSTGQIYRIGQNGPILVYTRTTKNVGSLAFAPNGTLFMADTIPTEGYQSIYKLVPMSQSSYLTEVLAFKPQQSIGGIAFNSKGELFYSDRPKGRLWKVVNGTALLYVDKGSWSTMYGIAFDQLDNLYFCDWTSPGNIYYLDFTLSLSYKVLSNNNVPLSGAEVSVKLPNSTTLSLVSDSTGSVSIANAFPGTYELSAKWQGVTVGNFTFDESASGSRNLVCNVYSIKITAKDSLGRSLSNCMLNIQLPNGSTMTTASPASLSLIPTGIVTATPIYNGTQVAGTVTINLTSSQDVSVSCMVHQLTIQVSDSNMDLLNNPIIQVILDGNVIANQTSTSGTLTLNGLLNGRYTVAVNLGQFRVAETELWLNASQTAVLRANLSEISVNVNDVLGYPMQGTNVSVSLPDGSTFSGLTDETGAFTLGQLPMVDAQVSVTLGNEKKELTVNLNESTIEISATFTFSSNVINALTAILLASFIAGILIIPQTRRLMVRLVRSIPIEVSLEGEEKDLAQRYSRFLSSTGLQVEEAKETADGETKIAVEGRDLPNIQTKEDHIVFLVSDNSVAPPRREIRVVKQLANIKADPSSLSALARAYSQATGIKALGVLVCEKVTDGMLDNLKGLPAEVVLMTKRAMNVPSEAD